MKPLIFATLLFLFAFDLDGQQSLAEYQRLIRQYEPNAEYPYGRINPKAPEELKQFDFMVGVCDCQDSLLQNSGKWLAFPSIWSAKYFLNGFGIQDNNFNLQSPTTNLRLFDNQTKEWKVTFASSALGYYTGVWTGKKEGDEIILYQYNGDDQPYGKLTFYEISEKGYRWKSQTYFPNGDITEGWKKKCVKRPTK